jgi:hypothetical protein
MLEKTANHIVYINFFVCHVKKYNDNFGCFKKLRTS